MAALVRINIGSRTMLAKTCPRCHEFKQAAEFSSHVNKRTKKRMYSGYCKRCHVRAAAESNKLRREKILAEAARNHQPWGAEEVKQMYALVDKGYSQSQIARRLRRTEQGITHAQERYPRRV